MIVPENKNDKLWILLIINNETSSMHKYMFSVLCFADWFHIIYMHLNNY